MDAAGDFNKRVTIKRPEYARGTSGSKYVSGWTTIGQRWASVTPLSQSETEIARGLGVVTSYAVRMRYMDSLDSTCRIVYGSKTFSIDGVIDEDERHETHVLTCSEGSR